MKYRYPEQLLEMDPDRDEQMLGGGWPFPVVADNSGNVAARIGSDHVKECIHHFALYDYGVLVGTPTFGGGVPSIPFNVITSSLITKKQEQMQFGLEQWEPRITDLQVTVGQADNDVNHLIELVLFEIEGVGNTEYLKFPFTQEESDST